MFELFVHQRDKEVELFKTDPGKSVEDVAVECTGEVAFVWLEDETKPLDPKSTLLELGVTTGCHIHVSKCQGVLLKVRFGGATIEEKLSPSSTFDAILKWAASPEGFKLTDTESAKHLLLVCGTDDEIDRAEHLGSFVDSNCAVCLDLVPKERFEGSDLYECYLSR